MHTFCSTQKGMQFHPKLLKTCDKYYSANSLYFMNTIFKIGVVYHIKNRFNFEFLNGNTNFRHKSYLDQGSLN